MVARATYLVLLGLLYVTVTSAQSTQTSTKPSKLCYACSYVAGGPGDEYSCVHNPWVLTDTVPCGDKHQCFFTYVEGEGVHYATRGCTDQTGASPPYGLMNTCAMAMGGMACHYRCDEDHCNYQTPPDIPISSSQSLPVLSPLLMVALVVMIFRLAL